MSRQSLGFGLLCLFLILSAGCGGDDGGGTKPCQGTPGSAVDYPLDVGNSWTYGRTRTEEGETTTSERVDQVLRIEDFKADPYAVMRSTIDDGISDPLVLEQYLAQRGQDLFMFQPWDTSGVENEIEMEILVALLESQPWKIAAFTGTECDSWDAFDFTDEWTTSSGDLTFEVKLTVSNRARTSVTVQAGNYTDVYVVDIVTSLVQKLNNPFTGFTFEQTDTQRMYIKDGIGVVKEETVSRGVLDDGDEITEETVEVVANLKSFTLVP